MVTYVMDSSAVLRYLHSQAGADRMAEIIRGHLAGDCQAVMPAAHWGEVAGITCKLYGRREMERVLSRLSAFGWHVVAADGDSAVRAALIKVEDGFSLCGLVWGGTCWPGAEPGAGYCRL